tara:strand:- start:96 stop:494 length:399 start_codon:yes stop_codon:yes gene_type:complete
MKLTAEKLKKLIKEELKEMVGKPIYGVKQKPHPMVQMSSAILKAAQRADYSQIMMSARKYSRDFHDERMKVSQHKGSHRNQLINSFADAIYNYQESKGLRGLEGLIRSAEEVKFEYQTHDERDYGDDTDMNF